jgi:FAD/FMN-containing dehydrogenase
MNTQAMTNPGGERKTSAAASMPEREPGQPDGVADDAEPGHEPRTWRAWRPSRRQVLSHAVAVAGALVVGEIGGAKFERLRQAAVPPPLPPSRVLLDDASELDATVVRGITFAGDSTERTAQRMIPLLQSISRGTDPPMVVSGARHSMGGHSLLSGGWVMDALPMNSVAVNAAAGTVRVGGGATWKDVIAVLNAAGFAPKVMQSNHDFTVGGSLSVNCHGWHTNSQPIASTVQRLRVLTADRKITTCSREVNPRLLSLALGGYGMFGIILEADLAVVPNVMLKPAFAVVPTKEYATAFAQRVYTTGSRVEMAYGRLSVDPHSFLEQAIIGTYIPIEQTRGQVLPVKPEAHNNLRRAIFGNSVGSDTGKSLRWLLEKRLNPMLAEPVSRNSILSAPVNILSDTDPNTVYILHEYFVPQDRLWEFIQSARTIIRAAEANLLNVTVRDVRQDQRSTLAYARQDVFGLVMTFVQQKTPAGETQMRDLTRHLIDAALGSGGTYYLPYRPHATLQQFRRAYPAWTIALQAKAQYDPDGLFRNTFYDRYIAG